MSKSNTRIHYLDYAASVSANPSSIHLLGVRAKQKLDEARREVALVLSARPREIIFTSGGTESNNLAVQGVVFAFWEEKNLITPLVPLVRGKQFASPDKGRSGGVWEKGILPHIVTTNIEHPSVLETCKLLEKRKLAEVTIVPVEESGIVNPKKIKQAIKKNTVLVSVMSANNEIGTVQPVKEIAKEIRHYKKNLITPLVPLVRGEQFASPDKGRLGGVWERSFPLLHTDAVQAVSYLDLNVDRLGVDLLSLSGTKIEGAGRVGLLFKKKGIPFTNIFGGGDQEQGLRPGTENLPEILKFAKALKTTEASKEKEVKRLTKLRDYFLSRITKLSFLSDLIINGDLKERLPNNVNITFPKIPSDLLVIELSAKGIMASSKSACKSSKAEGSYVIKALRENVDPEIGGLRFSFGKETSKKDLDYTIKSLTEILKKLKRWYC